MRRFINILFFILLANLSYTQTVKETNTGGNWNVAGNWTPSGIPTGTNAITANHDMTINQSIVVSSGAGIDGSLLNNGVRMVDAPGGTAYNFVIQNNASVTIDGYTEFGGWMNVSGSATLTIKGCDTLYIHGNVTFSNNCIITIEPCAVLKIDGNLILQNNNTATVDGTIDVAGNVEAKNNSVVSGTGVVYADGTITTSNAGTFFGSTGDCTTGPCEANQSNGIGGLPVQLYYISGEHNGWEAILYWETLSETNNDYFEIESSSNGETWDKVGFVKGWGNSNQIRKYKWIDNDPYIQTYYRLKQVDIDGKWKIIGTLYLDYIQPVDREIEVNPNPVLKENPINIQLRGFKGDDVLLILIDALGNEYFSKFVMVNSDSEVYIISIDDTLNPGIYVVRGSSRNELYNKKILIR